MYIKRSPHSSCPMPRATFLSESPTGHILPSLPVNNYSIVPCTIDASTLYKYISSN